MINMRLIQARNPRTILASVAFTLSVLGLTACNGDSVQGQSLGNDWVQDAPIDPPAPRPTPTSTSSPSPTPTTPVSDLYTGPAEVAKYVERFVEDAKNLGVDVTADMRSPKLSIQIKSLDSYGSSVIGLCETGTNLKRVTFDPDFWNSVSDTQKELLSHHELGHCVLFRGHRTATLSTGAFASIMYPVIMSTATYQNNYKYYLEELFTWSALQVAEVAANQNTTHICNHTDL